MKLPIYLYGHPVLRRQSEPVAAGSAEAAELKGLVADMFDTMYAAEGVGLAAPQVGRNIRLVVIDASPMADTFAECAGRRMVLVNPEVTVLQGPSESRSEGCLSLPGMSENVSRVEHINLRWLDEEMQPHEEEISGFLARIVQHECDHLDGHLYIDRVSPIRRQLAKGKLNSIASGRTRCDYPARYATRKK